MIDRRQVLARGGGAFAAFNLGIAARGATAAPMPRAPVLFLVDTTLDGSDAVIETVRRASIRVAPFAGDIGTAWLEHLDPLWRNGPAPIAGMTTAGALFCAEHLARGYGITCSFKSSARGAAELAIASLTQPALPRPASEVGGNQPLVWTLAPRKNIGGTTS